MSSAGNEIAFRVANVWDSQVSSWEKYRFFFHLSLALETNWWTWPIALLQGLQNEDQIRGRWMGEQDNEGDMS